MDLNTKELIQRIVNKLVKNYMPEKIILFGSYAYGKPDKDSDLDLLIVKNTDKRHIDSIVEVCKILDEENRIIALEPLVYTPSEIEERIKMGDGFLKTIFTKGIVLYE